jgi:hypothetical protein
MPARQRGYLPSPKPDDLRKEMDTDCQACPVLV